MHIHKLRFRICYIPRYLKNSITHWWSQYCSIFVIYISCLQLQLFSWFLFKFLLKFYRLCVKISSVSNVNVVMRHIHELNIQGDYFYSWICSQSDMKFVKLLETNQAAYIILACCCWSAFSTVNSWSIGRISQDDCFKLQKALYTTLNFSIIQVLAYTLA